MATSPSIRSVLEKIGLTPAGGNYETIKKHIRELDLDMSHFLGQGILRNKTHNHNACPLDKILIHGKNECLGLPIPLELHHKDGDRTSNSLQNNELLCPNCHSLADNYRGSKKKV